jgi:hypothetical protein
MKSNSAPGNGLGGGIWRGGLAAWAVSGETGGMWPPILTACGSLVIILRRCVVRLTVDQCLADIAAIDREIARFIKFGLADCGEYVNEFDPTITVAQVLAHLEQSKAGKEAAIVRLSGQD